MKGVIIFSLMFFTGAGLLHTFFLREMWSDQGHDILMAFGAPRGDTIQMNLSITFRMVMTDPPRVDEKKDQSAIMKEWVAEHFQLRDESGEVVRLQRMGMSAMLINHRAARAADSYLGAELKQGQKYVMEYVPRTAEAKRYRFEFMAPLEPEEPWHKKFLPVEES